VDVRAAVSLDLIIAALFLVAMYSVASAFSEKYTAKYEDVLLAPSCYMLATDLALSQSVSGAYPTDMPSEVVSYGISGGKAYVELNGFAGTYRCEVSVP
jgi:hypothetical protein